MSAALLTPSEVAVRLVVPVRTVTRMLALKRLVGLKVAGKWRVTPAALDAYLAQQQSAQTPETKPAARPNARIRRARRVAQRRAELPLPGADYYLQ